MVKKDQNQYLARSQPRKTELAGAMDRKLILTQVL